MVAHQVILKGNEKLRAAGIALARTTAAELAIDPARRMAFGADDKQSAECGHAFAEFDVGAAAGHVGGNGDGTALSC